MRNTSLRAMTIMVLFLVFACKASNIRDEISKPNIIIICVDDLEMNEVGAFGCPMPTPNIDRIIKNGIKFNRFYVSSPLGTPSRFSTITGRYASRNKALSEIFSTNEPALIKWNTILLPEKELTVAHLLRDSGYVTGMVGKWQLGQPPISMKYESINRTGSLQDQEVDFFLKSIYNGMRRYIQLTGGFDYVENIYGNNLDAIGLPQNARVHNMEWVVQGGLDFIEKNKDNLFFLYFNPTIPHEPDPVESMKADPRITARGLLDEPITGIMPPRDELIKQTVEAGYPESLAAIRWLDEGIGAILKKLDELKLTDNTLIIFTSDNGRSGKMTCYEAGGHMPAAIMWKGVVHPGSETNELISNVDFTPTIIAATGIEKPDTLQLDGINLMPLLTNNNSLERETLYQEVAYQRAIITKEWKYIVTRFPGEIADSITHNNRAQFNIEGKLGGDLFGADKLYPGYFDDDQLYDLISDPDEQNNLAGKNRRIVRGMKSSLEKIVNSMPYSFGEFKE